MNIKISDNFTYKKLIKFTIPTILMMIITSIYVVVDGIFVSNFCDKAAFPAINLIMPFLQVFGAFGFMLGTGGCALVAKCLGEKKKELANEIFSLIIFVLFVGSTILAVLGAIFLEPIAIFLGADEEMLKYCLTYGRILLFALPAFVLQTSFQTFVVVANKPTMGMLLSIASGLTNMTLDALFIIVFDWGVEGAALATITAQIVGGIIPLIYFLNRKSNSDLHLSKFKWNGNALLKSCTNGASEMMTNLSLSVINMLYNFQLMKYIGQDGVSAYGVIMYISFIFIGVFIGFTLGSSPIISYNYGAANKIQLKSLFKKSVIIMIVFAVILTAISEIFAGVFARIFSGENENLFSLSTTALRLYSISFLFASINIFASAFFTALNNGKVSAIISFLRTLLFQALMILVLPLVWDRNAIWLAVVFAEILALFVTIYFLKKNNKHYGYF